MFLVLVLTSVFLCASEYLVVRTYQLSEQHRVLVDKISSDHIDAMYEGRIVYTT